MKKKFVVLLALCVAICCLASCQLSEIIDKPEQTTPVGSQTADTTTAAPSGDTQPAVEYEPIDFMSVDPLAYVTPAEYKGVKVTLTKTALTDDAYNQAVASLLAENAYYTEITDRAAAEGDTLSISYKVIMNGELYQESPAGGATITLGENSGYIEGFAEGLVGAMPGTTVTLDMTFPEDYYEDLANKPVTFEVSVHYIQGEHVTPAFDDEFVTKYSDGEYTTVAAFGEHYRTVLQEELDEQAKNQAVADVWKQIIDGSEVKEYPEQHVMYYYGQIMAEYEYYASYYSVDVATVMSLYGVTEESIMENARLYAKEDMVFYCIVRAEGLALTDEEYSAGLAEIAQGAGVDTETLESYYGEDYIRENLTWDKVIGQIFEWASVTEA